MRDLLFLAHRIPFPPDKGDKIRSYNILMYLAERYRVHLGCFIDDSYDQRHRAQMEHICEESFFAPLNKFVAMGRSLTAFTNGSPQTVAYYKNGPLAKWIGNFIQRRGPMRIFVFSAAMAQYVMPNEPDGCRRVLDLVDVDSDKWRQYGETRPWPLSSVYRRESVTLARYEAEAIRKFDASLLVSEAERDLARRLAPESAHKVHDVHNGVDAGRFDPNLSFERPYDHDKKTLVFTGAMDYWPNVGGVTWFARHVFPMIRERLPEAEFVIVGANPTPDVRSLQRIAGVTVTGRVADTRPYLAYADVVVAPLLVSRGIQNKVLEAMSMAKPIVATPNAIEGLEVAIGDEVLVEADAAEFANAAINLMADSRSQAMGQRARARVVENYQWNARLSMLEHLIEDCGPADDAANSSR